MAGRGSPPLSGYLEGVGEIDIPHFPLEPNSIDGELDSTIPPREEDLLRTSPLGSSSGQGAQPPTNPLPGGVPAVPSPGHPDQQGAAGGAQPQLSAMQQELLRRCNPLQVLSPEDIVRIEARTRMANSVL